MTDLVDFQATLNLLNGRLDDLLRMATRAQRAEDLTTRVLRVPVGLTSDRPYAVVGGPSRGRQWQIKRVQITASDYPITLYCDESLSLSSTLWIFDGVPAQETFGRDEMVLVHPDVLVCATTGFAGDTMAGQIQVVDIPLYGSRNEQPALPA
jgi:hypothetical protein